MIKSTWMTEIIKELFLEPGSSEAEHKERKDSLPVPDW